MEGAFIKGEPKAAKGFLGSPAENGGLEPLLRGLGMAPGQEPEPQTWALAAGRVSPAGTYTSLCPAWPGLPAWRQPFAFLLHPWADRSHMLASVCPPVKWGDARRLSHMEEPGAQ